MADIGYRTVQVSATCAFEAAWLAEQLAANGLSCAVTHTPPQRIAKETDAVIRAHQTFGCRYIGIGMAPGGMDRADWYEAFARDFRPRRGGIAASGALMMYHNHNLEFARTGRGREIILERMLADFPRRSSASRSTPTGCRRAAAIRPGGCAVCAGVPCIHQRTWPSRRATGYRARGWRRSTRAT